MSVDKSDAVESKAVLVAEIAELLGMDDPGLSTGSTERKSIFLAANELLALGCPISDSKPVLGRAVVEAAGFTWQPTFESRGSTVTRDGLVAFRNALRFLLDA
jgi:hypothetical protein